MKNILLSIFTCITLPLFAPAQQAARQLAIAFNKNILQPGDSLIVTATLNDAIGQKLTQPIATLDVIIENELGGRTRLRWPVIDNKAAGTLYLPDSLPHGKYTLFAGLQQRFFEVTGRLKTQKNMGGLQAMLLTKNGSWDEQEVAVAPDGSFTIKNWLFEDNALLAFSDSRNSRQPLDISISTQLDSSYTPIAVAGRVFYVGTPTSSGQQNLERPVEITGAAFADQGNLLPAVLVQTTVKTRAQQFNEAYVTGMFKSGNERIISIMDDPNAMGLPNVLSYLRGRVAGLQITQAGSFGGGARWRGGPVTFFMDEMRVSAQQVANIPMADIAIVKAYPPPFFGAPGGGGAIAIYTRRGAEARYLPENRKVFRVRGYTATKVMLNMDKLEL